MELDRGVLRQGHPAPARGAGIVPANGIHAARRGHPARGRGGRHPAGGSVTVRPIRGRGVLRRARPAPARVALRSSPLMASRRPPPAAAGSVPPPAPTGRGFPSRQRGIDSCSSAKGPTVRHAGCSRHLDNRDDLPTRRRVIQAAPAPGNRPRLRRAGADPPRDLHLGAICAARLGRRSSAPAEAPERRAKAPGRRSAVEGSLGQTDLASSSRPGKMRPGGTHAKT